MKTRASSLRLLKRLAWPIIVFSLLTAAFSVYYTFTHLRFSTSRSELVSSDLRLIRLNVIPQATALPWKTS